MRAQVVLFTGGYESTACLIKARQSKGSVTALFFDYGQPYLAQEFDAATRICKLLGVALNVKRIPHQQAHSGIFADRNERFISHATYLYPEAQLWFGCRAPLELFDRYGDSNWQFACRLAHAHHISIRTPCICWPKFLVKWFVGKHVPQELIYSSEGYDYDK